MGFVASEACTHEVAVTARQNSDTHQASTTATALKLLRSCSKRNAHSRPVEKKIRDAVKQPQEQWATRGIITGMDIGG